MRARSRRGSPKINRGSGAHGGPVEVVVERLSWGGRGVAHLGGKVVFVPKAVPGDRLLVEVTRERKSYSEARPLRVLAPGAGRVDPRCPWFDRCGGCQWLAADYPVQLSEKEALLRSALRHHLEGVDVEPLLPAHPAQRYRHRGDFHAEATGEGIRLGFFEEGSHRLVEVSDCLLFERGFEAGLGRLRDALACEHSARSLVRLTLAHSEGDAEALVVHGRLSPGTGEAAAAALLEKMMGTGLRGAVLSGARSDQVLAQAGDASIAFHVPATGGELQLRADVRSFTQAHFGMNRELVRAVLAWLAPHPEDRVLDLYSGVGNFSLPLAKSCAEVVAVEGSPSACADALKNAAANGVANVRHMEGAVAPVLERLVQAGERFDRVLLDPPRTGAKDALARLGELRAPKVLYIACDLSALERDLGALGELGYRPARVRGFDCFPQTYALETLCLLERRA